MSKKLYVNVDTVMQDLDVSRPKAYSIIRELNKALRETNPNAIIIAGKVNRNWYDMALLNNQNSTLTK